MSSKEEPLIRITDTRFLQAGCPVGHSCHAANTVKALKVYREGLLVIIVPVFQKGHLTGGYISSPSNIAVHHDKMRSYNG